MAWFRAHGSKWNVRARPELRIQVAPTRVRIPDVTVIDRDQPVEQVLTRPPFAVFEVLSPDETLPRTMQRLADFSAMGIRQIWVVDLETAKFYRYAGGGLAEATQFAEPGERVRLAVAEIQGFLD